MPRNGRDEATVQAMREHVDFQREQRARFEKRIVAVARDNPDLTLALLAERFGVAEKRIKDLLHEAGVNRTAERLADLGRVLCGVESKRAVGLEREHGPVSSMWRSRPQQWTCRGGGLELKLMAATLDEAVSAFRKYAEERGVVLRECTARKLKRRAVPFRFPEVKP